VAVRVIMTGLLAISFPNSSRSPDDSRSILQQLDPKFLISGNNNFHQIQGEA
jgi:hypothetical protein